MDLQSLIAYIRRYANDHYNSRSVAWDVLVECWSDEDIAEELGDVRTERGARRALRPTLRAIASVRMDVQAEADYEWETHDPLSGY